MKFPTRWFAILALGALLAAGAAPASAQDPGGSGAGRDGRRAALRERGRFWRAGRHLRRHAIRAHLRHRRQAAAAALALTPDQQRLALEKARAAEPLVAEGRREVAKLLVRSESDAKAGGTPESRAERRTALKDARKRTWEKLAPLAKDVLASLTPEQRAKIEGFAAARGRQLDEERLVRRVSKWLARPMTADLLEARLGTR